MRFVVALFVFICASGLLFVPFAVGNTGLDDWNVGSTFDFSVRLTNPIKVGDGRMGIFFNSLQPGPLGVQTVDLESLSPGRLVQPDLIDLGSNEAAISAVKSATNPTIVYLVIGYGSQGIIRKYNATYTVEYRNDTQVNSTEIRNPDGSINDTIVTGNITTFYVDFIPHIQRTAAPHTITQLPLLHSGVLDEAHDAGYFVGATSEPSICKIQLSTMTLDTCVSMGTVGVPIKLHLDSSGQLLYLLTQGEKLLRMSTAGTWSSVVTNTLSLSGYGDILAAVFDTTTTNVMIASVASVPDASFMLVDLSSWTIDSSFNITVPRFNPARGADVDLIYGYAYFAAFSNPPIIARINLQTRELVDTFIAVGSLSRATSMMLAGNGRDMWIVDFSNVLSVSAPSPCPGFCSGHGVCNFGGQCSCTTGWQDVDCNQLVCGLGTDPTPGSNATAPDQCSGVGLCLNGTCSCYKGYSGSVCSTFECPRGCNDRGSCDKSSHVCSCDRGFNGTACELTLAYLPCEQAYNCTECGRNPNCVWCAASSKCLAGSIEGPTAEFCPDWHYRSCPEIGFTVVAAVLTAIWAALFLVNVFSVAVADFGDMDGMPPAERAERARAAWWREMRSTDSWFMVETFQYVGLFATLGSIGLPTYVLQYSRVFQWSLIAARPIWEAAGRIFDAVDYLPAPIAAVVDAPLAAAATGTKRAALDWVQTAHTTGSNPSFLVIGCVIVFLIILAILALVRIALALVVNRDHWRDRWVHVVIRVVLFFQIPLVATGAAAIVHAPRFNEPIAGLVIGVIVCFLYVVGSIVVTIYFARLEAKQLYLPANKRRFEALAAPFNFRRKWFIGIPLIKKTLIALSFGFLASSSSPAAALALAIVISVVYGIVATVLQVYIEFSSLILDLVTLALQIAMWGLCFGFIQAEPIAFLAIIIAAIHCASFITCLITYFIHWMRYKNVHNAAQLFSCGGGGGESGKASKK